MFLMNTKARDGRDSRKEQKIFLEEYIFLLDLILKFEC